MVQLAVESLKQIAAFLKQQGGKITVNDNSLPTRVINKNTTSGYINIILELLKEAQSELNGNSDIENVEIRQWIEYGVVYVLQAESLNQVLKELNTILLTKTYLVSHKLTVADLFLYYLLHPTMVNMSILDKEKYVNLSRWFDNLQQNPSIRQSNKMVDFSTLYLVSVAPVRH